MRKVEMIALSRIQISDADFINTAYIPKGGRVMDDFTKKILFCAEKLYKKLYNEAGNVNPERIGLAIGTATGPLASVQSAVQALVQHGYRSINPSFFPNVMLSAALSACTVHLCIKGPCCLFYEPAPGVHAKEYCLMQLSVSACDFAICLRADEHGPAEGELLSRKE